MSAKDTYPILAIRAAAGSRTNPTWMPLESEAIGALDEIDALRRENAWLRNIADGRGEENEILRSQLNDEASVVELLAPASWFWCTAHQTATSGAIKGPATCTLVGPYATRTEAEAFRSEQARQ
jgi:hypothetical protein